MARPSQQSLVQNYLRRLLEVAVLFVFVLLLVLVLGYSMKYILPFVIGWLVALFLKPFVQRLEKNGIRRTSAVLIVLLSTVVTCVLGFVAIVTSILREAFMLSTTSSLYFRRVSAWISHEITKGRDYYGHLPPQVTKQLEEALQDSLRTVEQWLHDFVRFLLTSVTHLPETIFIAIIALITAFFILRNPEGMSSRLIQVLPPGWGSQLNGVLDDMQKAFFGTLRVQVILVGIAMVMGISGMWVMGFPYAVILGILFGIFGIIPILGSALMTLPWAIAALFFGDIASAVKLIALQIIVSITRHIIEPKILANSVGLDTLSTLFSMYIGYQAIGFLGLFLGPIVLIGLKSLLRTHLLVDFIPVLSPKTMNEDDHQSSD